MHEYAYIQFVLTTPTVHQLPTNLYELHDNSIGRSAMELLRKLQAAKFTDENPGMVCPASWKPGKGTLKPGVDLIGKI